MTKAKILVIDIETAPLELHGWKLWDENFSLDQISKDWSILSYAAKWLGKKKIFYADTGGRGAKRVRDDKPLMKGLLGLLNQADIVIAQNGKKFDVRKINARLAVHGFKPPEPYRVIDTMLVAKKYFAFTSQKLKYTSEAFGVPPKDDHDEFQGFKLWAEVLKDNPKAWRVMKRYNKQDIVATEHVYLKMRPWIENHPNLGVYSMSNTPICPNCGSPDLERKGRRANKQGGSYMRLQCHDCGAHSREKINQLPVEKRKSLIVGVVP
jgi:RNase P subunit RPR2